MIGKVDEDQIICEDCKRPLLKWSDFGGMRFTKDSLKAWCVDCAENYEILPVEQPKAID